MKKEPRGGSRSTSVRSTSVLAKIAGVSSFFVFLAVLVLAGLAVRNMQKSSRETAVIMVENKIKGDVNSFRTQIATVYGGLRIEGGRLVRSNGVPLDNDFILIDSVSRDLGDVATIFVREGDDFKRITTSIVNEKGERAVGTMLGKTSAAYAPLLKGKPFIGDATILGEHYIAGYEPIFAPGSTTDIIGVMFVGVAMDSVNEKIARSTFESIVAMIIAALVILAVTILLNIVIFKSIFLTPLKKIMVVVEALGQGCLNRRINLSTRDEIGELSRNLDATIGNLAALIAGIKKNAATLWMTGNELAENMTKTAAAINQITATIDSIGKRVENESASVASSSREMASITAHINELNDNITAQTDSVTKSSAAVEEMLANIQSVTQILGKNNANVESLAEASEIGKTGLQAVAADIKEIAHESEGLLEINAVMQNIASRTNLLSMNAAIEAAHAGEAGRGFAVVADEIRKLAENSGAQSKTISAVLKKIKESIDKISLSTETVLAKFEAIDSSVKTVSDQELTIRASMEEQSEGSRQILEAISCLNEITSQVKDGAARILEGSRKVSSESTALETETTGIASGMTEMAQGAQQINGAVNNVNTISGENKTLIDSLVKSVERFVIE